MKKILLITIGIATGFVITMFINQTQGADLGVAECPQVITAKSIKQNTIDYSGKRFENMTRIKLPDVGSYEIEIGEDLYTKDILEAIK